MEYLTAIERVINDTLEPSSRNTTGETHTAVRDGQTIAVDDTPTDAWEIRLSLPGIASLFWSATYWFRTQDGLFVRSEAVRG